MTAPRSRRWPVALAVVLLPLLLIGALLFAAQGGLEALRVPPPGGGSSPDGTPAEVAHGEYLAHLGNCITCHTRRGGAAYAGGRAFDSKYGTLYSTNITPDIATGIGEWSIEEFRHAMRHGVSRDGLLYPAFPFANFARLTEADIDALFAFLRQLPAVDAPRRANELGFPARWRPAILGWRMLHHRPRPLRDEPSQSQAWNRGRYLVDGVGHCGQCHSGRGSQESLPPELYMAGGRIPGQDWYAPPLDAVALRRWSVGELAGFLRSGTSVHGAAYGSMAEVVQVSLQHLTPEDAVAIATYITSIPPRHRQDPANAGKARIGGAGGDAANGAVLYRDHCESCHEADGRGRDDIHPPLAGNPLVTSDDPVNAIRLVLHGGVAPSTRLNPRPRSMPSFADRLDDDEVAAVVNHIRNSWGNSGTRVTADDIREYRRLRID